MTGVASQVELAIFPAVSTISDGDGVRTRGAPTRFALYVHSTARVVLQGPLAVEAVLDAPARPVRATLFDKTAAANWLVPGIRI